MLKPLLNSSRYLVFLAVLGALASAMALFVIWHRRHLRGYLEDARQRRNLDRGFEGNNALFH
jgi:hypothetical protein